MIVGKSSTEKTLIHNAFSIARRLDIRTIAAEARLIKDLKLISECRTDEQFIWLFPEDDEKYLPYLKKGDLQLAGLGQSLAPITRMKYAIFVSLMRQKVEGHHNILCLLNVHQRTGVDTLSIVNPQRDYPWLEKLGQFPFGGGRKATLFVSLLETAVRFAQEGREGKPIGTIFLYGDPQELEHYTHQLILNPCAGHAKKSRSFADPAFVETLREYAAMDGAFVIDLLGTVLSAGTYIDVKSANLSLKKGLGSRHAAALAVTEKTSATAFVISESSRTVTVYLDGKTLITLG